MKHTRTYLIIGIILLLAITVYIVYPKLEGQKTLSIFPVALNEEITCTQDQSIHFYKEGFAVIDSSGAASRFYNWDGDKVSPPIKKDDLSSESVNITYHTDNHIVTDEGKIFDTSTAPFKLIYDNPDLNIWDIKEYGDFLLILIKTDSNIIEPKILVNNSDFLLSLDGMENTRYLSSAYEDGSNNISFLNMSLDSSVPVTRVFHFINRNEIYGVLSLNNEFIYNIYRVKSNIILIGTASILCYNVDGELKWQIEKSLETPFQIIELNDELLIYFPDLDTIASKEGNTLWINTKGEYSIISFPKYLSNLQAYKDGFLAIDYRNILFYLNSKGRVTKETSLNSKVSFLDTTPFQPDAIFIKTDDNILNIYTTNNVQDNGEEEMK